MKNTELNRLVAQSQTLMVLPQFQDIISRRFADSVEASAPAALNLKIHPNDQMLTYSLSHFQSSGSALSQYFGVALQQHKSAEQIISALFPSRDDFSVLDFACGYGRMLRFLAKSVGPKRIWASDIQSDAVDFVVGEFGVNGVYSDVDPDKFKTDKKFDFIWVASLFSHLPGLTFNQWLAKLREALSPRGVICFSVHDEVLLAANQKMDASGIAFASESENAELAKDAYGTTHVTEAYVRGAVERAFGASHPYFRVKRGLAYQQDLYIVAKDKARDLSVLNAFKWGPWGWVDVKSILSSGDMNLSGWATSFDEGGIDSVTVFYDGKEVNCKITVVRADVEGVFKDSRLHHSGWETVCPLRPGTEQSIVEILANGKNGERSLLYAGPFSETAAPPSRKPMESLLQKLKSTFFK
jgi:SAM-dependent methyltransferase